MVCTEECDDLIYYKIFDTNGIKKQHTPRKNVMVTGDVHIGDMANGYSTRWEDKDTPLKRLLNACSLQGSR